MGRSLPFVMASVLALACCNAPGPHFRHLPATRLSINGATFDVRVNRNLAEAIRINPQYAPRLGPLANQAAEAMRLVSGCDVVEVRGDAALTTGVLDCGAGRAPSVIVVAVDYECVDLDPYLASADGTRQEQFECTPVPR